MPCKGISGSHSIGPRGKGGPQPRTKSPSDPNLYEVQAELLVQRLFQKSRSTEGPNEQCQPTGRNGSDSIPAQLRLSEPFILGRVSLLFLETVWAGLPRPILKT